MKRRPDKSTPPLGIILAYGSLYAIMWAIIFAVSNPALGRAGLVPGAVVALAFGGILVFARPMAARYTKSEIIIDNPVFEWQIPWSEITGLRVKDPVELETKDGRRIKVWVLQRYTKHAFDRPGTTISCGVLRIRQEITDESGLTIGSVVRRISRRTVRHMTLYFVVACLTIAVAQAT